NSNNQVSGRKMAIAIVLNIFITISQIIGGLISGSVALLSDALHNFSDVISLILSYITNRLAKKKSTEQQTYGFKRAEILSAFINSVTLIAIAIYLIVEAVERFINPQVIDFNIVIVFASASVVINLISVIILHKDSKGNMNIKSAYLHLLTDVMTSLAVVLGGFMMKYFEIYRIDSILSFLIAFYLIFSSYKLTIESIKILMQFTPNNLDIQNICKDICSLEEIVNTHHVHLWQLNDKDVFFEAHIDLQNDITITDFQGVLIKIENILDNYHIHHFNIQPEYNRKDNKDIIVEH
ncbi:MAG: cation diffusion facilitator family transporter, partial [Bacteroidales bacterium]|nr:cation diffusion facilitator family transporter [Bacteroidales bacterium]